MYNIYDNIKQKYNIFIKENRVLASEICNEAIFSLITIPHCWKGG